MAAGMVRIKGDQTPDSWLSLIRTGQELGTGVFLSSVHESKEFTPNITYDDAKALAQNKSALFLNGCHT